jgi:hypothetical protein
MRLELDLNVVSITDSSRMLAYNIHFFTLYDKTILYLYERSYLVSIQCTILSIANGETVEMCS